MPLNTDEVLYLTPDEAFECALIFVRAGLPFFLWGPPGIGKSALMKRLAKWFGAQWKDVRALLMEPSEARVGFNVDTKTGDARLGRPWWHPEQNVPTIILLDELNTAPTAVQNMFLEPLLENAIGGISFGDYSFICAAGNRESDRAHVNKMATPIRLRMGHLNMAADVKGWARWASGSSVEQTQQEDFPKRKHNHLIAASVLAFNRWTEGYFLDELGSAGDDEKKRQMLFASQTYATARGWEFISKLEEAGAGAADAKIQAACYAAVVSRGVAGRYAEFKQVFDTLPDLDAALVKPDTTPVPKAESSREIQTYFAMVSALARRVTKANLKNAIRYAERWPSEFMFMFMRDAIQMTGGMDNSPLVATDAFGKFVTKWGEEGGWD